MWSVPGWEPTWALQVHHLDFDGARQDTNAIIWQYVILETYTNDNVHQSIYTYLLLVVMSQDSL